ncbi:MAG: hypothetical protein EOM37_15740 [Proteobacteria bacterium]|jgi:DNA replication protein DnaC|nr:hypothetical protein [Pseudomonadota bacterium]
MRVYLELSGCSWISRQHSLIITGPTGVKKKLSRLGGGGLPRGLPDHLLPRLRLHQGTETISIVDGSYPKLIAKLAKRDLLIIDDWLRDPLRGIRPDSSRSSTFLMTVSEINQPC